MKKDEDHLGTSIFCIVLGVTGTWTDSVLIWHRLQTKEALGTGEIVGVCIGLLVLIQGLWGTAQHFRRKHLDTVMNLRYSNGQCVKCGYDMRAATSKLCPECGYDQTQFSANSNRKILNLSETQSKANDLSNLK